MRKVSVGLGADVAEFIRNITGAKKSVDDLGDEVKQLDHELDKIPSDAARAAAALKLLDGSVEDVGKHVDDLGGKNTGLAVLDSKIKTTRSEVKKLADEFLKTGDIDIFKKLGDSQGKLSALTKIRKEITSSIEVGVKDAVTGGVRNAAQSPDLQAAAIRLGIGLAAPILATLGGALAGATGFGIAGLGIAGAILGNPDHFQEVWGHAARSVKAEFIDATRPFTVEAYTAIAGLGPLVASWHLDRIFADAVKYVGPLVRGVEGFTTEVVGGIGALVEKGAPAVDALSDGMVRLGEASHSALSSIADGAEGGALALHDTTEAVALLIEGFGKVVEGAENAYGFIREHPFGAAIASGGLTLPISAWTAFDSGMDHVLVTQEELRASAEATGHVFNAQGDDLSALTQKLNQAAVSADTLAAAMVNKLFTSIMSIDQATLGIAESQTRLRETFEENRKTLKKHADQLDINTKQGQANRESVLASVTANMQLYQAQIAAGMSAQDAADAYDQNTAALEAQLRKAHLTQGEIDGLIGKYKGIPKKVDTAIAIEGLTTAINDLATLIRQINGIHDKTVTLTVKQVGDNPKGQSRGGGYALGGIRRAQVGMILPPTDPGFVLSAEPQTGGEALIPFQGISQGRAMSLMQQVGSGYGLNVSAAGGSGAAIALTFAFAGNTSDAMAQTIQRLFVDQKIQLYANGQRVQARR